MTESEERPTLLGRNKSEFRDTFRKSNLCSKLFYSYGSEMIFTANRNNGKIRHEELLDISMCDDETDQVTN